MQRIHDRREVGGEVLRPIARLWTAGVAVAAQRWHSGVDGVGQVREQRLQSAPRVAHGVHKQNRVCCRIALLDDGIRTPLANSTAAKVRLIVATSLFTDLTVQSRLAPRCAS